MLSLHETQRAFAQTVMNPGSNSITHSICVNGFSGKRLIQVYRNNIFHSLTEALRSIYTVVARIVGEDFFELATRDYIRQYPSRSGNLHDFGKYFPDFIATYRGAAILHYLYDVAVLEWQYHEVYHAADASPASVHSLADLAEDGFASLTFKLHPAIRLHTSIYPIVRIWSSNQEAVAAPPIVFLDEGGDNTLILRRNHDVYIESLTDGEYAFLTAIACGESLANAYEIAAKTQAGFNFQNMMNRCLRDGLFIMSTNSIENHIH